MPSIQIELKNADKLNAMLKEVGVDLNDLSSELRDVGSMLVEFYPQEVFPSEGRAIGERWLDLKKSTRRAKNRLFPGASILVATGAMRDAFSFDSDTNSLTFSNSAEYFQFHEGGTSKMPARRSMTENRVVMKKATEIIARGVFERISRTWK